jgi:hypothetical protein
MKQPEAIRLAVEILQAAGWTVSPPGKINVGNMLSPAEISARFNLRPNTLHRRLHAWSCPKWHAEYTEAGLRIRRIHLTPELEAYLSQPVRKPSDPRRH